MSDTCVVAVVVIRRDLKDARGESDYVSNLRDYDVYDVTTLWPDEQAALNPNWQGHGRQERKLVEIPLSYTIAREQLCQSENLDDEGQVVPGRKRKSCIDYDALDPADQAMLDTPTTDRRVYKLTRPDLFKVKNKLPIPGSEFRPLTRAQNDAKVEQVRGTGTTRGGR